MVSSIMMTQIDPRIFRAYDIRGKAHSQLNEEICELIGKGFGSVLCEKYGLTNPQVVVGRDARTHSPSFQKAMISGLVSTGCKVFDMGVTPSPVNYFTICNKKLDGGIQITASHNPAEDNGIKLQLRDAMSYSGDCLQSLLERIKKKKFILGNGSKEDLDAITIYTNHITNMFKKAGEGVNIAIDTGNGVAAPAYTNILAKLGCNITGLYFEQDGIFPNHPADPSKVETLKDLQKTVKENSLNLGIAFDGDGDRMGLVDENGTIRTADEILLLLSKDHLQKYPKGRIVFTVSNSGLLHSEIEKWGGIPILCPVGHSHVEHAMRENNSLLGGEQSGHFFCAEDYFGFDDALVAALRILTILKKSGKTVSKLFDEFPKVFQIPEKRPYCEDDAKAKVIERVIEHFEKDYKVETMDGARIDFGEGAWAGIRVSNTSPALSICIEARSQDKLKEIERIVFDHLGTYEEVKQ